METPTAEEQRAPDQDTAIEQAFVAGTLPEEDRRLETLPEPKDEPSEAATPVVRATLDHAAALRDFAHRIEHGFDVFVHEIEAALHL